MNSEIKEKWIAALRSGNYEQATASLRTVNDKFCCLGVLCDLMPGVEWRVDGKVYKCFYQGTEALAFLPDRVAHQTDLNSYIQETLTTMNDKGASFPQIADWIERNL